MTERLNSSEHYWRAVRGEIETNIFYTEQQRLRDKDRLEKLGITFIPIPKQVYDKFTELYKE